MYRYSVDNAVTYTSEDFVLFRESPFACWMERLTLENPDHDIPTDIGSVPPCASMERQDDMADTLHEEDKDVRLIDWDADEASRRSSTLEAMRKGVDFIVNGQLALGPLSGAANLLVRTSGYSELGDFLYIPCETQSGATLHSAFRLCFLADLLHSLQGQLPPQMLIIRGGDDLVPLQTEDHIYHYRAVKQRFMETMRGFRKHRMPDPAESAHFGRWSDCAHEVLKQRLLREEDPADETVGGFVPEPLRKAVGAVVNADDGSYDLAAMRPYVEPGASPGASALAPAAAAASVAMQAGAAATGLTLAEQARMLKPGTYKPGPGVYRLGPPRAALASRPEAVVESPVVAEPGETSEVAAEVAPARAVPDTPRHNRRASDAALQNLEFIGREQHYPGAGLNTAPALEIPAIFSTAPAPSLRDPRTSARSRVSASAPPPESPAPAPVFQPIPETVRPEPAAPEPAAPEPAAPEPAAPEPAAPEPVLPSAIDMDDSYPASPPPRLTTSEAPLPEEFPLDVLEVPHSFGQPATNKWQRPRTKPPSDKISIEEAQLGEGGFSSSLITSDDYQS